MPSKVVIGPDGPINSDVSRVNIAAILHAQWAVTHCGVYTSSATIALGLTLSWFPTSAETEFASNNRQECFSQKLWNLKENDTDIVKIKQWHV